MVRVTLVREQVTDRDHQLSFIVADLLNWTPARRSDSWHDRAVFHFLTEESDRTRYVEVATRAVTRGFVASSDEPQFWFRCKRPE